MPLNIHSRPEAAIASKHDLRKRKLLCDARTEADESATHSFLSGWEENSQRPQLNAMKKTTNRDTYELGRRLGKGPRQAVPCQAADDKCATGKTPQTTGHNNTHNKTSAFYA